MLISILLMNIAYPISELGIVAALSFIGVYLALTVSAVYLISSNRLLLIAAGLLGVAGAAGQRRKRVLPAGGA